MFQFQETVIGNSMREQMAHVLADGLQVEMLQAAETKGVEQDEDHHYLTVRQTARTVATVFTRFVYQFFSTLD